MRGWHEPARPASRPGWPDRVSEPFPLDQHKLAAARLWATDRHPYLASALFAAPVLPAPGLGQLAIDRFWRVHADPAVIDEADVPDLGGGSGCG